MHSAGIGATAHPVVPGSDNFYRDRGASAIMRAAHFPDELLAFLQMESLVARDTVARYRCDSVVELGCYDGRALEVARICRIPYLGVDVNRRAIDALCRRIADEGLEGQATAVHGNALSSGEWRTRIVGLRPLQIVPFNLIGNFSQPEALLREMSAVGGVALISAFNAEPWTTQVRRTYYSACGIDSLWEEPGFYGGIRFRGKDGFTSQSFDADGLSTLVAGSGATVLATSANRYGCCLTLGFS